MFELVYVSSARKLLSNEELMDILEVSRRNNSKAGITGALLYCDGNFMQLLEGEEQAVWSLYDRIAQDARHRDVLKIATYESPERWMKEWSMGFSYCASKEELDGVVNLAAGLDGVGELVSEGGTLRNILTGFVERNLRMKGL